MCVFIMYIWLCLNDMYSIPSSSWLLFTCGGSAPLHFTDFTKNCYYLPAAVFYILQYCIVALEKCNNQQNNKFPSVYCHFWKNIIKSNHFKGDFRPKMRVNIRLYIVFIWFMAVFGIIWKLLWGNSNWAT